MNRIHRTPARILLIGVSLSIQLTDKFLGIIVGQIIFIDSMAI